MSNLDQITADLLYNRALLTTILNEMAFLRAERTKESPATALEELLDMVHKVHRDLSGTIGTDIDRHTLDNL